MIDTRCGLRCVGCEYMESCNCGGCIATNGNPFHGACPVAECCQSKGYLHCGECPEIPCELLSQYSCDPEHGDNPPGARIEQCKRWLIDKKVVSLRMERQFLANGASEEEYIELYRDMQPGLNVYWNGFGQPPVLSFRAAFDDTEFNRERQLKRELIKGRFTGGNLGWIMPEEMELFAGLYQKPLTKPTHIQEEILHLIEHAGPLTIQQIKEETGYLVKEITPVLHRLQEAFLIYEDKYDGEWDRGWYTFTEMFPDCNLGKYSRKDALKVVLRRFAYRHVVFDIAMAKSYYKLPEKEIKAAIAELVAEDVLVEKEGAFLLKEDATLLAHYEPVSLHFVYAVHRNDFLYKSNEPVLKERFKHLYEHLEYDHEPLQYLLIDGEFHGAVVGHFRNGPYDLNDVVCDLPDARARKEEILQAIRDVNFGKGPERFMGIIV